MKEKVDFVVRSYGWTELAMLYSPEVAPSTASQRLRRWVDINPRLKKRLGEYGCKKNTRILAPVHVEILISYLGEP